MWHMTKPWDEIGMSRSAWYRAGKPTAKPVRRTQAVIAAEQGVSVRTVQRVKRVDREAPELLQLWWVGQMSIAEAERALGDDALRAELRSHTLQRRRRNR
jgi:hypothetical protein